MPAHLLINKVIKQTACRTQDYLSSHQKTIIFIPFFFHVHLLSGGVAGEDISVYLLLAYLALEGGILITIAP